MKVTFLGTGTSQGVPIIGCNCEVCTSLDKKDKRLRSSIYVQLENGSFVIDSGPDFRYQLLREGITDLDAVVYTHEHKDHIAGLDDVRPINFLRKKAINVYATERVQEALKRDFHYVFADYKYPGIPQIHLNTIDINSFELLGEEIIPVEGLHHKLPVLGFRVKDFCYVTDMNYISEDERSKMKNLDVLVINGLRKETHISHFTLDEAIEVIQDLKPKKAFITHISHQLGKHEEVEKELPENIYLAYDGLSLNL